MVYYCNKKKIDIDCDRLRVQICFFKEDKRNFFFLQHFEFEIFSITRTPSSYLNYLIGKRKKNVHFNQCFVLNCYKRQPKRWHIFFEILIYEAP